MCIYEYNLRSYIKKYQRKASKPLSDIHEPLSDIHDNTHSWDIFLDLF
jgi:hypothetical protein